MTLFETLFQWIDLLWFGVVLAVLPRQLWIKASLFVLICVIMLRLQIELFESFGWETGYLPFLTLPLFARGLITYGVFTAVYLMLSAYSARINPFVYMAASITIFIIAFCVSSIVMVL